MEIYETYNNSSFKKTEIEDFNPPVFEDRHSSLNTNSLATLTSIKVSFQTTWYATSQFYLKLLTGSSEIETIV